MRLSIDGRTVEVEEGRSVLEAARSAGVAVPSLCDRPGLEAFGGCRLCLVEIAGRKGYLPSCAVAAEEGMEVRTDAPALRALRRRILELILSEHPYACLVCAEKTDCDEMKSTIRKVGETTGCVLCPANGRCELQRLCADLGVDAVSLPAAYRNRDVRKDDPFFDRDPNLCILCGRCVRVCDEVRGASALAFLDRGPDCEVGTAFGRTLLEAGCQFCGACVDVCPTASLVDRGSRPDFRPDREAPTVCPLCGHGCGLVVGLRDGRVLASRPRPVGDGAGQACVKGRFAVREIAASPKRLTRPLIRKDGRLAAVGWDEALDFVAAGLTRFRPDDVAFLGSDQMTLEDAELLAGIERRFKREAGEDGRPGSLAARAASFGLGEIAADRKVILLGLDLPVTHPIAWLEVVRAVRRGADLVVVDTGGLPLLRGETLRIRVEPGDVAGLLADLASAPGGRTRPAVVLYDADGPFAPAAADAPGGLLALPLVGGINANGLKRAGWRAAGGPAAVPAKAVFALSAPPGPRLPACEFLVLEQCFLDDDAPEADACLPAASFLETSGSYLNLEGRVLTFEKILDPPGEARPDGWILSQLARRLGVEGPGSPAAGAAAGRPAYVAAGFDRYRGLDLERNIKGLRMLREARRARSGRGR